MNIFCEVFIQFALELRHLLYIGIHFVLVSDHWPGGFYFLFFGFALPLQLKRNRLCKYHFYRLAILFTGCPLRHILYYAQRFCIALFVKAPDHLAIADAAVFIYYKLHYYAPFNIIVNSRLGVMHIFAKVLLQVETHSWHLLHIVVFFCGIGALGHGHYGDKKRKCKDDIFHKNDFLITKLF